MKTLDYYLSLPYSIQLIPDEGEFIALIPDLPGCMSSGTTPTEAVEGLEEAKELWISGRLEKKQPIPEPKQIDDYSGKFVLRIPRSLHKSLDYEAEKQGVSLNQYLVHLLSERHQLEMCDRALGGILQGLNNLSKVYRPDPDWSWPEDAMHGGLKVAWKSQSKYDPLDTVGDIFGDFPAQHLEVLKPSKHEKRGYS